MVEIFDDLNQTGMGQRTHGQTEFFRLLDPPVSEFDAPRIAGFRWINLSDLTFRSHFDPGFTGTFFQAFNDALRTIRNRKHATVRFGLRGHATFGKPFNRILGLEMMKSPPQLPTPSRIAFAQLPGVKAMMSKVAPTTS